MHGAAREALGFIRRVVEIEANAATDNPMVFANEEDHVSMSMSAALKAERALDLARRVLAVEMLCACQAIDLLARLTTSAPLARVHARIRAAVPTLVEDRPPAPDVEAIAGMVAAGELERATRSGGS